MKNDNEQFVSGDVAMLLFVMVVVWLLVFESGIFR